MTVDIKVPALGESVTEATIAKWLKAVGDAVGQDEPLVELETDKVTVEVPAAQAGVLQEIVADEGTTVEVGSLLGRLGDGAASAAAGDSKPAGAVPNGDASVAPTRSKPAAAATDGAKDRPAEAKAAQPAAPSGSPADLPLAPSVRRLIDEHHLDPATITASGKDGRLTKGDVLTYLETAKAGSKAPDTEKTAGPAAGVSAPPAAPSAQARAPATSARPAAEREERVPMTRLRKRVAERLKEAQNTAAMLSTFNEADMSAVMAMRARFRDSFEKRHGVRLGFMSIFVKAAVEALRELPAVNAEIDGEDIVYKNHYDIGVAVSTDNGLVVPVLRDADQMSFADIEKTIGDYARRARDGKLKLDELSGGTFTITNGGVFGSLLSTPILNPPQSGILGMHKIQERPIVVDGQVVVRPMMYLAMSYDHRIVDGREAVTFLVRIKDMIEDPERLLIAM